jgi:hypothetical protein
MKRFRRSLRKLIRKLTSLKQGPSAKQLKSLQYFIYDFCTPFFGFKSKGGFPCFFLHIEQLHSSLHLGQTQEF